MRVLTAMVGYHKTYHRCLGTLQMPVQYRGSGGNFGDRYHFIFLLCQHRVLDSPGQEKTAFQKFANNMELALNDHTSSTAR